MLSTLPCSAYMRWARSNRWPSPVPPRRTPSAAPTHWRHHLDCLPRSKDILMFLTICLHYNNFIAILLLYTYIYIMMSPCQLNLFTYFYILSLCLYSSYRRSVVHSVENLGNYMDDIDDYSADDKSNVNNNVYILWRKITSCINMTRKLWLHC